MKMSKRNLFTIVAFTALVAPTLSQFLGTTSNQQPTSGSNPQPGDLSNQQSTAGGSLQFGQGTNPQTSPGTNSQTFPGTNSQSFPGTNTQTSQGTNSQTNQATSSQSFPGSTSQTLQNPSFPSTTGSNPQALPGSGSQTFPNGNQQSTSGATPQTFPGANPQFPAGTSQQPNPQAASCAARFEAAVTPQCFDASGVNFTGVIYLLSANRSGSIPSGYTYQSFVQFLCTPDMKDKIIPCVLGQMQKHNTTQCEINDRALLLGRGGQLLTFMEAVCGQPCEQDSTQSLIQCYAAVNVNPEAILSQNASIIQDKYSLVGRNESEFNNFCSNRQKLFSCLGPLSATCPGLLQQLYTIGLDLQAMESATGIVCSDKQKYLQGLTCYNTPSPEMTTCGQATMASMQAAVMGRYNTGTIKPSEYMSNLCKLKLTQMTCEAAAYGKTCDADSAALRTSAECAMFPKPCRESTQLQTEYNALCQKVTTEAPVQTVRPTQSKPGTVPVNVAGVGSSSSVKTSRNDADHVVQSVGVLMVALIIGTSMVAWS